MLCELQHMNLSKFVVCEYDEVEQAISQMAASYVWCSVSRVLNPHGHAFPAVPALHIFHKALGHM